MTLKTRATKDAKGMDMKIITKIHFFQIFSKMVNCNRTLDSSNDEYNAIILALFDHLLFFIKKNCKEDKLLSPKWLSLLIFSEIVDKKSEHRNISFKLSNFILG